MTQPDSAGPSTAPTIHGSAVVLGGQGVLIRGLPRSGKTSLGQALVSATRDAEPARLGLWVSDDRTHVETRDGQLMAHAPRSIAGRIADRQFGILEVPFAQSAMLSVIVDLDMRHTEQSPCGRASLLGISLPLLRLPALTPATAGPGVARVLQMLDEHPAP